MNSDKFDRVVLDLLYEELDELTTLAARRHMEQSARARDIYAHLKATRRLSVLPMHPAPDGFEESVLVREPGARAEFPLRQRLGRYVSMLAGYAMRPQLAMGALLLLMIGSSLLFLRARPGGHHGAIQVTERGVPETEAEIVVPVIDAPSLPVTETVGAAIATAAPPISAVAALNPVERPSAGNSTASASASAMAAAQATLNASGCGAAVSRFERVKSRFPGSGVADEALWRAAKCQQKLGDRDAARQSFESLLHVPAFAREAKRALLELEGKIEEAAGPSDHPFGIESEPPLTPPNDGNASTSR